MSAARAIGSNGRSSDLRTRTTYRSPGRSAGGPGRSAAGRGPAALPAGCGPGTRPGLRRDPSSRPSGSWSGLQIAVGCGSGLEPAGLWYVRARDLRAHRGGRAQATARADRIRRSLAPPALRHLRAQRGCKASGPAAQAPAPRRDKEVRSAIILRVFAVERFVRGLAVAAPGGRGLPVPALRPCRFEEAFEPRAPGSCTRCSSSSGINIDHSKLVGLIHPRADPQPDHAAGGWPSAWCCLRGDRADRGHRPVAGQAVGRVLRDGGHLTRPALRDLRADPRRSPSSSWPCSPSTCFWCCTW